MEKGDLMALEKDLVRRLLADTKGEADTDLDPDHGIQSVEDIAALVIVQIVEIEVLVRSVTEDGGTEDL